MSTIPASELVQVTPSVIAAGGAALDVIGLVLTTNTRPPIGTVPSFPDATSVADFFGPASHEAAIATVYFGGFTGADTLPAALLFAQYPQTAVGAYLRGGNISALTLAQLQAISGSLDVTIDGYPRNAGSVNLSSATSFSSAATIIATALNGADPTEASVTASIGATFTGTQSGTNLTTTSVTGLISIGDTVAGTGVASGTTIVSQTSGTTGGAGVYVTSKSGTASSASCTASSNVLNVTNVASGTVSVGQYVTGAGVTGAAITALGSGEGEDGTYIIAGSPQQVASESMTLEGTPVAVTYDSVSGAFVIASGITGSASSAAFATGGTAAALLLTQATGAVLSQGAAAATPASFMNGVVAVTQDWVTFMTAFDPDGGNGNTQKQAFAAWKNNYPNRFAYIAWDVNVTPTESVPAESSLGYILANNGDSGTALIYEPSDQFIAAFICGAAASIDFTETNGRITFAYKAQAGLTAGVTTATAAQNLLGNSYNFFGAYASANANFVWYQNGSCTGPFAWLDSYINQIWLNNAFQLALLNLLGSAKSIPYNAAGNALIEAALADPIQAGLNFGAFAPGTISSEQQAIVNDQAGANVASTLQTQGYYLQVGTASSTVRAARGSPPCTFWYLDRGSVQKIDLSSVSVQ